MIIVYFILIIVLLAYHCSCSYREDMSLIANDDDWGPQFSTWNCHGWQNSQANCPEGYFASGLRSWHGCGANQGNNLNFQLKCSNPIGLENK